MRHPQVSAPDLADRLADDDLPRDRLPGDRQPGWGTPSLELGIVIGGLAALAFLLANLARLSLHPQLSVVALWTALLGLALPVAVKLLRRRLGEAALLQAALTLSAQGLVLCGYAGLGLGSGGSLSGVGEELRDLMVFLLVMGAAVGVSLWAGRLVYVLTSAGEEGAATWRGLDWLLRGPLLLLLLASGLLLYGALQRARAAPEPAAYVASLPVVAVIPPVDGGHPTLRPMHLPLRALAVETPVPGLGLVVQRLCQHGRCDVYLKRAGAPRLRATIRSGHDLRDLDGERFLRELPGRVGEKAQQQVRSQALLRAEARAAAETLASQQAVDDLGEGRIAGVPQDQVLRVHRSPAPFLRGQPLLVFEAAGAAVGAVLAEELDFPVFLTVPALRAVLSPPRAWIGSAALGVLAVLGLLAARAPLRRRLRRWEAGQDGVVGEDGYLRLAAGAPRPVPAPPGPVLVLMATRAAPRDPYREDGGPEVLRLLPGSRAGLLAAGWATLAGLHAAAAAALLVSHAPLLAAWLTGLI